MSEPKEKNEMLSDELPNKLTGPGNSFYETSKRNFNCFHFLISKIAELDFVQYIAEEALDEPDSTADSGEERSDWRDLDPGELASKNPGPNVEKLREFKQVILEMFLAREVDNFQTYLVEVIEEILLEKPEILKTKNSSFTLEDLLEADSLDAMINEIIQKKVTNLSYIGFKELSEWCQDNGIELELPSENSEDIVEIIQTRNLIAHNRNIINQRYIEKVRAPQFELGDLRRLTVNGFYDSVNTMRDVVFLTDKNIQQKFPLKVCSPS